MLRFADTPTVQMAAVRPACPAWCSNHRSADSDGPEMHQTRLGAIGGVRIDLWRVAAAGRPMHASLTGGDDFSLIDIMDATALLPLADLFNAAAAIAASEVGRHRA